MSLSKRFLALLVALAVAALAGPGVAAAQTVVGVTATEIKVGNTILFDKYSGSKVSIDSNEYLIIKEEDILGIVEG